MVTISEPLQQRILSLRVLLAVLLFVPGLFLGGAAQAQGNLLANAGFEQAHGDGMSLTSPPGWNIWSNVTDGLVGRQLQRGQEVVSSIGIYEGNGAFDAYKGWSAYSVALYQTVSNITPGSTLRLSAFGRIWSCDGDASQGVDPCIGDGTLDQQTYTQASFRVGIDPTGANDPNAASIVWSNTTAPYTGFQQMAVDAAASGGSVTVVLYAGMQQPAMHQHVFWDAASLTVLEAGSGDTGGGDTGGETTAPSAPPAVAAEVVPQGPREDGSIVHTVRSGDTLAGIAVAYNITIPELLELNSMTMDDARFIYPGQELIVQMGDGSASPADEGAAEEAPAEGGESGDGGDGEAAAPAPDAEPTQRPIEEYESAPVGQPVVPVMQMNAAAAGRICALLFEDTNPNRLQESGEPLLAGGQIAIIQEGAALNTHTTDGQSEPVCFDDLTPGSYLVNLTPPDGYGATTPSMYTVTLDAGQTVDTVFGAAAGFVPPAAPQGGAGGLFSDEPGTETDTASDGLLDTLMQYSGVIVLALAGVVLVGGVGLTLLLRR